MHKLRRLAHAALCIAAIFACSGEAEADEVSTRFVKLARVSSPEAAAWLTEVFKAVSPDDADAIPLQIVASPRTKEIFLVGAQAEIQLAAIVLRILDRGLPSPW